MKITKYKSYERWRVTLHGSIIAFVFRYLHIDPIQHINVSPSDMLAQQRKHLCSSKSKGSNLGRVTAFWLCRAEMFHLLLEMSLLGGLIHYTVPLITPARMRTSHKSRHPCLQTWSPEGSVITTEKVERLDRKNS